MSQSRRSFLRVMGASAGMSTLYLSGGNSMDQMERTAKYISLSIKVSKIKLKT